MLDISSIPLGPNFKTADLSLSVKYLLYPYTANEPGSCDIPKLPSKAVGVPITIDAIVLVVSGCPSWVNITSLSTGALLTFFSCKISKLVFSAYNFCILPEAGSTARVISSPIGN